jgi:hypothetical protein
VEYRAPVDVPIAPRFFSLREANALVDTLRGEFEKARELRDQLIAVQHKLTEAGHAFDLDVQVDAAAPAPVQRLQARAASIVTRIKDVLRDVSELGVEVKAADGLVDFRSKLHGKTVYLCWKYGEERVSHYHELDAGFAGRKPLPIDGDFAGDLLH